MNTEQKIIEDFQQDEYWKDVLSIIDPNKSVLLTIAELKELFILVKRTNETNSD